MNEYKVSSLFQLTIYCYWIPYGCPSYPRFKIMATEEFFFKNLQQAETYIQSFRPCHADDVYAFVLQEKPYDWGLQIAYRGNYLSERVYLPDGTLWSVNSYASIDQESSPIPLDTLELGHTLGRMRMFNGRNPEEIHFAPGDIVEIFGNDSNPYWSSDEVNLGVVLQAPPTRTELEREKQVYLSTHGGYDITDHVLGYKFGEGKDVYRVATFRDGIDRSPTISTMPPRLEISPQRRSAYERLFERFISALH